MRAALATALSALLLASCTDFLPTERSGGAREALKVASWNLEHLAEDNGAGCRPRVDADYKALARHAEALGADVIAFQEVESSAAAERVFPRDGWRIVIEERAQSGDQGGCRGLPGQRLRPQKVGFAIRRDLPFTRNPDLADLSLGNDDLRRGVDVTIGLGQPLRLLSVHLKSGCNSGRAPSDKDCDVLFEQLPVLERWIDARASEGTAFAVLGDFNRRLASRGDAFMAEIDDAEPREADLSLASGRHGATCKTRYREFIDLVVLSASATARMIEGSFAEYTYGTPEEQHPSDHCPVSVELRAG